MSGAPLYVVRCASCFKEFREAEKRGDQRVIWTTSDRAGIRMSSHHFGKHVASWCKTCGDSLEDDRILYAAQHKGECRECRGCAFQKRF